MLQERASGPPGRLKESGRQEGGYMEHFKLPAGVRDVLPEESGALDEAEALLREKFARAGFRSVRTAGLEYYDTFTQIRSPVEPTKMFKMTDKDGNLIVLRPDLTLA